MLRVFWNRARYKRWPSLGDRYGLIAIQPCLHVFSQCARSGSCFRNVLNPVRHSRSSRSVSNQRPGSQPVYTYRHACQRHIILQHPFPDSEGNDRVVTAFVSVSSLQIQSPVAGSRLKAPGSRISLSRIQFPNSRSCSPVSGIQYSGSSRALRQASVSDRSFATPTHVSLGQFLFRLCRFSGLRSLTQQPITRSQCSVRRVFCDDRNGISRFCTG